MVLTVVIVLASLCILYKILDTRRRKHMLDGISKRAVFVTGCDSGFGAALVRRLDGLGCPVFAGCLTSNGADKLRSDCSSRLLTVTLDVTNSVSIGEAIKYVRENLPSGTELWAVVNNAGVSGVGGPLDFLSKKDFVDVFNVNVFGMAEVTRTFLPLLKRSRGRIVNTTSMAGLLAVPSDKPYTASKFAAEGLSDALRREFKQWGIGVSMIEPGLFRTALVDKSVYIERKRRQWDSLSPDLRAEYGQEYYDEVTSWILNAIEGRASRNIASVVDAFQHALFAVHPRRRYLVGKDAVLYKIMSMLPSFVPDLFFANAIPPPVPKVLRS